VAEDRVAVVRAMLEALRDRRMDDVVATLHSEVEWIPLSRPGLTLYTGHAGIRQMQENDDHYLGARYMTVEDVILSDDGSVMGRGQLVHPGDDGEPSTVHYEAHCTIRDGLIVSVETSDVADPSN
jgi:ketosteroid isomerase-like protein